MSSRRRPPRINWIRYLNNNSKNKAAIIEGVGMYFRSNVDFTIEFTSLLSKFCLHSIYSSNKTIKIQSIKLDTHFLFLHSLQKRNSFHQFSREFGDFYWISKWIKTIKQYYVKMWPSTITHTHEREKYAKTFFSSAIKRKWISMQKNRWNVVNTDWWLWKWKPIRQTNPMEFSS